MGRKVCYCETKIPPSRHHAPFAYAVGRITAVGKGAPTSGAPWARAVVAPFDR